ncbi:YncE family protein [Acidihalobacter ferrooxydans]|uniref:YncE family protein n=1 Tax=Acidihalobacter ferrooxydans TaxID=1765967 RepID=UPI0012EC41F2|nr:WD40 repeat domain-containing protein [Acidihalobacter ferrooxydans]
MCVAKLWIISGVTVVFALLASSAPFATAFAESRPISNHTGRVNIDTHEISGRWEIGAYSSPPKGPGPGKLVAWKIGTNQTRTIVFGKPSTLSGNSFYIAHDAINQRLYVPTLAGKVFTINARTFSHQDWIVAPKGSRVARISPDGKQLLVMSATTTFAYSLPKLTLLYERKYGGNAVVFSPHGQYAYIGGNMNESLLKIETKTGKVIHVYPISHSGDLAYADGKVFSANMRTGIMTVLYVHSGKIVNISTPEVDPHFSYHHIPEATAGFMQLAVDPSHHRLYAAGFSGHILKFSTSKPAYLGEISVSAAPRGAPDKLSGISILDGGRDAFVTVENIKTSVVVKLSTGRIIRKLPGIASNRWVTVVIPAAGSSYRGQDTHVEYNSPYQ